MKLCFCFVSCGLVTFVNVDQACVKVLFRIPICFRKLKIVTSAF